MWEGKAEGTAPATLGLGAAAWEGTSGVAELARPAVAGPAASAHGARRAAVQPSSVFA
eukprot:CAMPEP_0206026220 /NCGR_PEP_ID=MMETSP1464-20131121/41336_1 /ASSEMBLY_ACC=CAM_ASM_001124 /TAXON_ID=119497 /ORGANISM="Exanthemachrysis gayraliae, Strain RCC1523" /LENGTH=57 /DNA_ID=CAMNT_0053400263 /DNA_START=95 /DNA_END=266 /DNA_ORIENTATION=-